MLQKQWLSLYIMLIPWLGSWTTVSEPVSELVNFDVEKAESRQDGFNQWSSTFSGPQPQ